jgi:hypothetical protein
MKLIRKGTFVDVEQKLQVEARLSAWLLYSCKPILEDTVYRFQDVRDKFDICANHVHRLL